MMSVYSWTIESHARFGQFRRESVFRNRMWECMVVVAAWHGCMMHAMLCGVYRGLCAFVRHVCEPRRATKDIECITRNRICRVLLNYFTILYTATLCRVHGILAHSNRLNNRISMCVKLMTFFKQFFFAYFMYIISHLYGVYSNAKLCECGCMMMTMSTRYINAKRVL